MRRFTALIVAFVIALCSLSACSSGSYEDGYSEGYDDGYIDGHSDAEYDLQYLVEEKFSDGYDMGYEDGQHDAWEELGSAYEYEAIHYARKNSGWSPEEAWSLIESYQNNEPFYQDGSLPSEQDYINAINSLIYFYDYFYTSRYK